MYIQTINPSTNIAIKSFEEMTDQAVDIAVTQAEKAYKEWRKTTYEQWAFLLHKVTGLMMEKKEVLSQLQRKDMPITTRLFFDGRVNTDKEYTLGLHYFVTRSFSISRLYDCDYGAGVGISIRY